MNHRVICVVFLVLVLLFSLPLKIMDVESAIWKRSAYLKLPGG